MVRRQVRKAASVGNRAYWTCALLLLLPLWIGSRFPSEDGPAHLYWIEVYRSLGHPSSPWAGVYERSTAWNTPQLLYFGLQYSLAHVIEPHLAQRIILSLLLLCWAAGGRALAIAARGRVTLGALAGLLLLNSSWLYRGYISFLIGIPIFLVTLALLCRWLNHPVSSKPDTRFTLVLAALGLLSYYAHFVFAGLYLVAMGVAAIHSLRRAGSAVRLVIAATPTALMALYYLLGRGFGGGGVQYASLAQATSRFFGLTFWKGFSADGVWFRLTVLLLVLTFSVLALSAVTGLVRGTLAPAERYVVTCTAVLGALYFALPTGIGDTGDLPRRIQLAMWAGFLPILPHAEAPWVRRGLLGLVSLLMSWQLMCFSVRILRFNHDYTKVLLASESLQPRALIRSAQRYDRSTYAGSFEHVLAHAVEDVALYRGAILLDGFHPGLPFYWVRRLPRARIEGIGIAVEGQPPVFQLER